MDLQALAPGFLVATPALRDPNFSHAVVMICVHNDQGAMGLVVNRPSPVSLGEIMRQLGVETSKKHEEIALLGGPVALESGVLLYESHDSEPPQSGELEVAEGLRLCPDQRLLREIASGEGPTRFLMFLGHAGWGPRQLELEISQGVWMPARYDADLLFDSELESKWENALSLEGLHPGMLGAFRAN